MVKRILLAVVVLLLSVPVASAQRVSPEIDIASEYVLFQSICLWVEIHPERSVVGPLDRASIGSAITSAIDKRLRAHNLNFPLDSGRGCFQDIGKRQQLSLWLYIAIDETPGKSQFALSLILHTYFRGEGKSAHEFPTSIRFCSKKIRSDRCIVDQATSYIDMAFTPILADDEVKKRRK